MRAVIRNLWRLAKLRLKGRFYGIFPRGYVVFVELGTTSFM